MLAMVFFSLMIHSVSASCGFVLPAESQNHTQTLMTWPDAWSADDKEALLQGSKSEIKAIAQAVSQFEPVTIFARAQDIREVERSVVQYSPNIFVRKVVVDNPWARDTLPVFVSSETSILGVDFNFNDWGRKGDKSADWPLAKRVLSILRTPRVQASIVAEGGAIEVDGEGTLLATESSIINDNRNPGISKRDIEKAIVRSLGIKKFIWLKGVKGYDITDDHVDGLVRFAKPGVVVLSRPATKDEPFWSVYLQAKSVLSANSDAAGRPLQIYEIEEAQSKSQYKGTQEYDATWSYVNWYFVNGGLIIPRFGIHKADEAARSTIQSLFPERRIIQVELNALAVLGGGIHCVTKEVPKPL